MRVWDRASNLLVQGFLRLPIGSSLEAEVTTGNATQSLVRQRVGLAFAGIAALFVNGLTRSTITDAATITVAQLGGGILYQDCTAAARTMVGPTAAQITSAFPVLAIGKGMIVYHSGNSAANASTITAGANVTLVGSGAVINTGGVFALIRTAATTYDYVRVG